MPIDHLPKTIVRIVLFALVSALSAGCLVKDSLAPGCKEYFPIAPMGGCEGKTVIQDLTINPALACLTLRINNCNGGIIDITNGCDAVLVLDGLGVEPNLSVGLDVEPAADGYRFVYAHGNFSAFAPVRDQRIAIKGELGGREVTIAFTKTAPMCP